MHKALLALFCAVVLADATQKFPQLRPVRRDGQYTNSSISTTTSSSPSSPLLPTSPPSTSSVASSTNQTIADQTLNQNTSTTTTQESCSGSVTYLNSVPPTVYVTVTEPFTVTVSASNASLPAAETITPPVACVATVIPQAATEAPAATSSAVNPQCPDGVCLPGVSSKAPAIISFQPALTVITLSLSPVPSASNAPQIASTAAPEASTGSAFTSTVFVTKKTPVPVLPPSSAPPVFQIPSTTTKKVATAPSSNGGGGSPASPSTAPNAGTSKAPPATSPNVATTKAPAPVPVVISQSPTTTQIGNIIASIINSPFTPIGSSSQAPATPVTTKIDNVPVQILSSSVVIGGQILSIPDSSSKTTLQVNGQTFTVQNSQIIAPGTTFAITPEKNQVSATALPSPVTAEGLTFSVGASQAVISGKTYAIGVGAGSSTTVVIGSETLTIGTGGVILPSTTVAPVKITAAPLAPEVITAGGITFTVGPSLAFISGSTYTIGPGAKSTDIVVGGKTISIGSNGIGLASTTIAPEPDFSVITVNGLTFSVDSSEAILGGTTYHIGKGAPATTKVVNGKTISLGPGGVGLLSTTIPPETGAAPTSTGAFQAGAASCSFNHWSALSALIAGIGAIAFF